MLLLNDRNGNNEMRDYIIFYPYEEKQNTNYYITNMIAILKEKYNIISLDTFRENIKLISRIKAVHLNWFENNERFYDYFLLLLLKLCGTKVIWVFHNKQPHECSRPILINIKYKYLAELSNTIIIHSKNSKKYVKKLLLPKKYSKIKYVEHISYIGNYRKCEENIRVYFGIEADDLILMFLGQIRPYKNLEILIEAFKEIETEKCKLVIAGKPANAVYAKAIKKLCKDSKNIITDFKFIPDNKMAAYLEAADILVLPYNKKSSINSGAMIMAFSYSRTVIIPDIAMAKDYEKGEFCYVYKYDNDKGHKESLKMKMQQAILLGREENIKLGESAFKFIKKHNNKRVVKSKIEGIFS